MKTIENWSDLRSFGFDRLTGEACAYGMRQLVDMSAMGAATWREFLGLPYNATLAESWNSGTHNPSGPSVASAMIPYDLFRQLAVFCLFKDGAASVVVMGEGVEGWYPDDDQADLETHLELYRRWKTLVRTYSPLGGPRVGSRMTHAMSGRTD